MAALTFPNVACKALMFCASSKKPMSLSCCSCDAYASSGGVASATGGAPPMSAANGFAAPAPAPTPDDPAPPAPGIPMPGGITPLPWSCVIARCICIIARRLSGLVICRRNSGLVSCSRIPGAASSIARIRGSESIICCITAGLDIMLCIMLAIAGLDRMASIWDIIWSGVTFPIPPMPIGAPPRPGRPAGAGAEVDPAPEPALGAQGLGSGLVLGLPSAAGAAAAAAAVAPGAAFPSFAPKSAANGLSA
mmetsp:Transcript_10160/g.41890  ORF Transcript_10160/g.41890 Transcript_10160/m.41890 type:complete len:250 (-) Transcript_10160:1090-1839(-)